MGVSQPCSVVASVSSALMSSYSESKSSHPPYLEYLVENLGFEFETLQVLSDKLLLEQRLNLWQPVNHTVSWPLYPQHQCPHYWNLNQLGNFGFGFETSPNFVG